MNNNNFHIRFLIVSILALSALLLSCVAPGTSGGTAAAPAAAETQNPLSEKSPEQMQIWRLQIRLVTGKVDNADCCDEGNAIRVHLNDHYYSWLDYARDDFERGDDFIYDLPLDSLVLDSKNKLWVPIGISTLSDIAEIQMSKTGDDGWCLQSLQLIVNNEPVFDRVLGDPCQWLDTEKGHVPFVLISGSELRAHSLWPNSTNVMRFQPPEVVYGPELISRIESGLGHVTAEGRQKQPGEGNINWESHSVSVKVQKDFPGEPPTIMPKAAFKVEDAWPDVIFNLDDLKLQLTCEWLLTDISVDENTRSDPYIFEKTVQRALRDLVRPDNGVCDRINVQRIADSDNLDTISITYINPN